MPSESVSCPYCGSSNPVGIALCQHCGGLLEVQNASQILAAREELPAGTKLNAGKYEIGSVLGCGGFGIAYAAQNLKTGETVAIKELFPPFATRDTTLNLLTPPEHQVELLRLIEHFKSEASIVQQIGNASAINVKTVFLERGTAYMVMEWIDGISLEMRFAQHGRLSEADALEIMIPVLNVLEELYNHQFLHRDIKPANIMLRWNPKPGEPQVELVDFGSAMHFDQTSRIRVTSRLLTPAYAPLELYGKEVKLEPATDLYALAATMYEMVTGQTPPNALDRANGVQLKSVRGLNPQISEHLARVLEKALEMSINNRFSSAHSMLSALYLVDILTPTINTQQTSMILPSNSGVGQVINPVPARAPNFVMIIVGVVFGTFFYCFFTVSLFHFYFE